MFAESPQIMKVPNKLKLPFLNGDGYIQNLFSQNELKISESLHEKWFDETWERGLTEEMLGNDCVCVGKNNE